MPNTNTTKTTWTPNATQQAFLAELANYADGITLFELKLEGKEYKTGSINTLISKGLVTTDEAEREFACDIMFNGAIVGRTTKKGKVYRLANRD